MTIQSFAPGDDVVAEISNGLAVYNQERATTYAAQRRRRPLYLGLTVAAAIVAIYLAYLPLASRGTSLPFFGAIVASVLAVGWVWAWTGKPGKQLQQGLRNRIIPKAFGFIEDVGYQQGAQPSSYSHMPQVAVGMHNRRAFDDIISGTHNGFPFEVYETSLGQKSGKTTTVVFKGIIMAFKLDKPFAGVLVATKTVGSVTKFFRDLFGSGGLVQVDSGDAALDALYEFRSDNPHDARQLMNSGFREALDVLRDRWPEAPARVVLSGSDGFVLLPTRRNFFELPSISTDCQYKAHIEPMVGDICALLAIAEQVKQSAER